MEGKIKEFIDRRFPKDSNWLDGNCYWFAFILSNAFESLEIYYEPIVGHFYAGDGLNFYDWRGRAHLTNKPLLLDYIKQSDPLWYYRLKRDCID